MLNERYVVAMCTLEGCREEGERGQGCMREGEEEVDWPGEGHQYAGNSQEKVESVGQRLAPQHVAGRRWAYMLL